MGNDLGSVLPDWEENAERRLRILEQKIDKLLDPEIGIYAKLSGIKDSLKSWALVLLTAMLVNLAFVIIAVLTRQH